MAGRTADISTSSFKPLDLNEIMMVPLAKQKMEDEFLAGSGKVNQLEAQTLSGDQDRASQILNGFKDRASSLSENVIEKGVSRSEFNKLRGLRQEVQGEYGSQGFLGNAMANKKAAGTFVNDLATKKERQAGWSPAEAKQWAQMQVGAFGTSQNEDGTFNSFSGKELNNKVDEAEWLRKNIDDVAEHVQPTSLRAVKIGGLPAFQKAFASGEVSVKDFNTIMQHLSTQAGTDIDLQRSLLQGAAFTGEKNALDHGKFETKSIKQKDGTMASRQVWTVGKSRFGARMAGMGDASDYNNLKLNYKIIKDDVGYALWKTGMDEQQLMKMVGFANGEESDVTRGSLSQLRTNLDLALDQSKLMLDDVNRQKKSLLSNDEKYQELNSKLNGKQLLSLDAQNVIQEQIKTREDEVLSGNDHYVRSSNNYDTAATKWSNAKFAVEAAYTSAEKGLNKSQKEGLALTKEIEKGVPGYVPGETISNIKALELALERSGNPIDMEQDIAQQHYNDLDLDNKEAMLLSKYLESNGHKVEKNARADRSLLIPFGTADRGYDKDIVEKMRSANIAMEKNIDKEIAANPRSQSYRILTASDTGGLKAPSVSKNNEILKLSLNLGSMQMAFGGGLLNDDYSEEQIGSSTKGYSYTPQMTDSWDNNGQKIVNIQIKNLETGVVSTAPIINNNNRENDLVAAQQLVRSGNAFQARIGQKIIDGYRYMPAIKDSNMADQNQGIIGGLPFTNKSTGRALNVDWVKSSNGAYYTASIDGTPLNKGQAIYGEEDMLEIVARYVSSERERSLKKK
tara:strand:+ start:1874 stop:4252 length:2379 start_codon:yes stop_codon:yes gene_type:complete